MSRAIILMGVSGSGKSTLGLELAREIGWPFYDGDEFHPPQNIAKMTAGEPLDDQDRQPWLKALNQLIRDKLQAGQSLVLACSALKRSYRQMLRKGVPDQVEFVFLQGEYDLIQERMNARPDHYMAPAMLSSQFDALEVPQKALILEISRPAEELVAEIIKVLELR